MTANKKLFGKLLQNYRVHRAHLYRHELARATGVSSSYLYYLEKGNKRASREVVSNLSRALKLSSQEAESLLSAAGHDPVSESELESAIRPIRTAFEDSDMTSDE